MLTLLWLLLIFRTWIPTLSTNSELSAMMPVDSLSIQTTQRFLHLATKDPYMHYKEYSELK